MADFPGNPQDLPLGDVMGDVPLLREIQRVLLSSSGPVNWELARQVGIAMAAWGTDDPAVAADDTATLADMVRAAELAIADLTGLPAAPKLLEVRAFRRAQWVEANTRELRDILDPVAARLGSVLGEAAGAGPVAGVEAGMPMLDAVMSRMAPLLLGAQVGGVLGYLGQRVFSQFDLPFPTPGGGVSFVVPNIRRFEQDWSLPPIEFRGWVALHEVAHALSFGRASIREHFVGLVKDLVEHADFDVSELERRIGELDVTSPEAITQAVEGVANVFGHASTPEQRLRVARVQAFVAAAEGYADHVVDTLGRKMLASHGRIAEAVLRFREGRSAEHAMERLLGLEMDEDHYRLAAAFCQSVVESTDEPTLARMWESPDLLPSMPELEEPTLWLTRAA